MFYLPASIFALRRVINNANNRDMKMKTLHIALILTIFSPASIAGGTRGNGHGHDQGKIQSGVGEPASGRPDRIVLVAMYDSMRFVFEPTLESLHHGETVEFRIRNEGNIPHEFSIGNLEEQLAHAQMMRAMPSMKHDDPNAITLNAGERGRLSWRFLGNDEVVFACNIPGHAEAGMKHSVAISRDSGDQLAAYRN